MSASATLRFPISGAIPIGCAFVCATGRHVWDGRYRTTCPECSAQSGGAMRKLIVAPQKEKKA